MVIVDRHLEIALGIDTGLGLHPFLLRLSEVHEANPGEVIAITILLAGIGREHAEGIALLVRLGLNLTSQGTTELNVASDAVVRGDATGLDIRSGHVKIEVILFLVEGKHAIDGDTGAYGVAAGFVRLVTVLGDADLYSFVDARLGWDDNIDTEGKKGLSFFVGTHLRCARDGTDN